MKSRIAYLALGIAIGITTTIHYANKTFSNSFSSRLERVYLLGCVQGVLISERLTTGRIERGAAVQKCLLISTLYHDTLLELMEKPSE